MGLVRYHPLGFGQLQDQINRLFGDIEHTESSGATADWAPAVDIHELAEGFQIFVDLPGMAPEDVEITLDNGVLTLTGERLATASEGLEPIKRRVERGIGRFHRRFILPDTVDADNVRASERHGVLEISIPKQAKAQPRRITVAA